MKVLVLGATGLLGTAVMRELRARKIRTLGAARKGSDLAIDVSRQMDLFRLLTRVDADVVINCAANINLAECEADPDMAYRVNTAPASVLAAWSLQTDSRFIQVSTDHYFDGDLPVRNDERALVKLVNGYAASKFVAENMARQAPKALILRTNICGAQKGFGKWVLDSLLERAPMKLFSDYFTSTMHVSDCAKAIVDLIRHKDANGVLNLASREVSSKLEFVHAVAKAMGIDPDWTIACSVEGQKPERARACGLDVTRAETLLGRKLPTLAETAVTLVSEDKRCAMLMNSKLATALSA